MVVSMLTCQVISPRASAWACRAVRICCQVPSRCQRRNSPYTVCHGPYRGGRSRHGAPVRVRQRIPSISCRLLQVGGRPDFLPVGSSGSSLAHCSLVRSPRPIRGASHGTPPLLKHPLGGCGRSLAIPAYPRYELLVRSAACTGLRASETDPARTKGSETVLQQ